MLFMSVETDSRTVCGRVLKEVLGFRPLPVLPEQFPVRRFQITCSFIRNSLLFRNRELPSNHLKYRRLPRQKTAGSAQKWPKFPVFPCFSLLFMVTSRDRIALNCTIRHPVWPIAALQRRMRFSARLARFCRIRCHQRRARRAELASFSVLVSNLDFRVPRLRQRGERAADRAVQRRKRGRPRGPESRPGLPWRSRLARSGPGAARAWIQVSALERGIPLLDGVFPARTGNPNRRHRLRHAPDLGLATGR